MPSTALFQQHSDSNKTNIYKTLQYIQNFSLWQLTYVNKPNCIVGKQLCNHKKQHFS